MATEKFRPSNSPRQELLSRIFHVTQSVTNPHVQSNFRLVPPRPTLPPDIEEFVFDQTDRRHIAVLKESAIAQQHAALLESRIPVLSGTYLNEGLLLLDVPSGTRPMSSFANSIRRNPSLYAEVFQEIGAILGNIDHVFGKTLQPTADFPLLKQFGAVHSEEEPSGGRVLLLPPYGFGDFNRVDVLSAVHNELLETRAILPEQADFLVERVDEGWRV